MVDMPLNTGNYNYTLVKASIIAITCDSLTRIVECALYRLGILLQG